MQKSVGILIAGALLALPLTVTAAPGGVTPAQLINAGWACVNVPNHGYHCNPPGTTLPGDAVVPVIYFDGGNLDSKKIGTEMLIRKDAFHDQPCPQDGGQYVDLEPIFGLPYMACHRREFFH